MIEAKTPMVEDIREKKSSEYFIVDKDITPVNIVTSELIMSLMKINDEVIVPENKLETIVVSNRDSHFATKFFGKMSSFLDTVEWFLNNLKKGSLKSVEQEKYFFEDEKTFKRRQYNEQKKLHKNKKQQKIKESLESEDGGGGLWKTLLSFAGLAWTWGGGQFANQPSQSGAPANVPYTPSPGQIVKKGNTTSNVISGYPVNSGFGFRWGRTHGGLDVATPTGTYVALKKDSEIDFAGWQNPNDPKEGYGIYIDAWVPSMSKLFRFAHMSTLAFAKGDSVPAGHAIGQTGNTGYSTAEHLHAEVHDQKMNGYGYGTYDPTPWMGEVVLGTHAMAQQAEGSIERAGRIMVGEAGPEFTIPLSQFDRFLQLMVEEKYMSRVPSLEFYHHYDGKIGFEREYGFSRDSYGAGGIADSIPFVKKHEALGAFVPGTGGGNRLADYIGEGMSESIKGTPRSKAYDPSTTLHGYLDSEDVPTIGFGTTFYDTIFGGRKPVKLSDTSTVGKMDATMKRHLKEIDDQYTEWWPLYKHFKPTQQAGLLSYLYNRGPNSISPTYGYGPMIRAIKSGNISNLAKEVEIDTESVGPKRRKEEADLIRSGPHAIVGPKIVGPKEVGPGEPDRGIPGIPDRIFQRYFRIGPFNPKSQNQSSLNNISDEDQMRVASLSDNFVDETNEGETLYFYQPNVFYRAS
jgi:murein DD-endopeptidase MepM/ murein hydrolase activator NlpD/GH24 family phage-related lysozyme (muramidase)